MKTLSLALVPIALLASIAYGQAPFQINTPNNPTQCVPVQITWTSGGQEPFFLSFNNGNANGPAVQQYTGLTGNSFRWETNVGAGTTLGLALTDNNGQTALSAPFTVGSGPDSSCLTGGSSSAPASSGGATTPGSSAPGAPSSSAPAGSSPATSGGATTSPAGTTPGGSSTPRPSSTSPVSGSGSVSRSGSASGSAPATTSSGAANANQAAVGAAGIIGAVVAAIIA